MLDEGIEKLDGMARFSEHFQRTKEATFRRLVQKEGELGRVIEAHYSAKVEDRQSKINSLQSQINPHFLYNTLECIRSEAVSQKNEGIANMAKALASFFRYSISRKENMVTIEDELNNIKNYIMIQNYRFEDKFRFEVEIEGEDLRILSYLIPKMTIQPIVENSIYHGLETKLSDCCVKIAIRPTERDLILVVSDNGIGMCEDTLVQLRNGLENGVGESGREHGSKKKDAQGNGIALYNVNQRIKLIFGTDYGLSVYSTKGIGTDVEIWIPVVDKM
ncbi:MAG TPA: sensor histidine kinase [Candidatus Pelethocola excrementipullorum]|nr:sensor histidine kinase [Candidatus Pelethocola excrementipullorum]